MGASTNAANDLPNSALLSPGEEAARAIWVEALAPHNLHWLFAERFCSSRHLLVRAIPFQPVLP